MSAADVGVAVGAVVGEAALLIEKVDCIMTAVRVRAMECSDD